MVLYASSMPPRLADIWEALAASEFPRAFSTYDQDNQEI